MSDFDKNTWIDHESEGLFSRNTRNNTCSLVGGLIGFDYSSQGGRRNTDPKLIWGMSVKMTLLKRAKNIHSKALIAQRLKRLSSISIKLKDNPHMDLSQMQDIGGCRCVLPTVDHVDALVDLYKVANRKYRDSPDRPVLVEEYDYLENPKPDGYRSSHLVYKYQSKSELKQEFRGQRIEIQIRSKLQHAWATAVEISQAFTGQALKAKIKTASSPQWLRFFALMGSAIADLENRTVVPDTPENARDLANELRYLDRKEKILVLLHDWQLTMKHLVAASKIAKAHLFLLELNTVKRSLGVNSYSKSEISEAEDRYLELERETESNTQIQVVLVSVDSIGALRSAYPNYYVDSSLFITTARGVMFQQSQKAAVAVGET